MLFIYIYCRCIQQLLLATSGNRGEIWVSYLQIYCEVITDLLASTPINDQITSTIGLNNSQKANNTIINSVASSRPQQSIQQQSIPQQSIPQQSIPQQQQQPQLQQLSIRERGGIVFVEGLSRMRITKLSDLDDVLHMGDINRNTASTNLNETSSRSHAALIVTIIKREDTITSGLDIVDDTQNITDSSKTTTITTDITNTNNKLKSMITQPIGGVVSYQESKLVIVDLAGSERAAASEGVCCIFKNDVVLLYFTCLTL